ncbi:hypothetical protein [Pseudescherichia sp.]|uniref:hypothetical protein n=1 Tax=Pseudescherichia sp. TaxID=2055881 RepID=UPI00289D279D|nr:hypothetical protein [Pseudescherichia sp.]
MKHQFIFAFLLFLLSTTIVKAEYCDDQLYKDMSAVDTQLGDALLWQKNAQVEAVKLQAARKIEQENIVLITKDTSLGAEKKIEQITAHNSVIADIQQREDSINSENSEKNKEIDSLKNKVPQALAEKAKECARQIAPLNLLVNIGIQGLALFFTDGASIILPEKALYVDMGEVVHGNVMGGPKSLPNQTKDAINKALGLHL